MHNHLFLFGILRLCVESLHPSGTARNAVGPVVNKGMIEETQVPNGSNGTNRDTATNRTACGIKDSIVIHRIAFSGQRITFDTSHPDDFGWGTVDPYCYIISDGVTWYASTRAGDDQPQWSNFSLVTQAETHMDAVTLTCEDEDITDADDFLGNATIPKKNLARGERRNITISNFGRNNSAFFPTSYNLVAGVDVTIDMECVASDSKREARVEGGVEGQLDNKTEVSLEGSVEGPLNNSVEGPLNHSVEGPFEGRVEKAEDFDRTDWIMPRTLPVTSWFGGHVNYLDKKDEYGFTKLMYASKNGDLAKCEELLRRGACVDSRQEIPHVESSRERKNSTWNEVDREEEFSDTPLILAARGGHEEVTDLLIRHHAKIDAKDGAWHATALANAADRGHDKLCTMLIDSGANVNAKDSRGYTPLRCAAHKGHFGTINTLARYDAHPDIPDIVGRTALMDAASDGNRKVVKVLIEKGAAVDLQEPMRNRTALMFGVMSKNSGVVRELMLRCTHTDIKDENGLPASAYAKRPFGYQNFTNTVDDARNQLLDSMANRTAWGENIGETSCKLALHLAAGYGRLDILIALIAGGKDVDERDGMGRTASMWAAESGCAKTFTELQRRGANIDLIDSEGMTALDHAELKRKTNIVEKIRRSQDRDPRV